MRPVQYFSGEYLARCREMSAQEIAEFLESFRLLHAPSKGGSRLISMKVNEDLLSAFRLRCRAEGFRYQTQIKALMRKWLTGE